MPRTHHPFRRVLVALAAVIVLVLGVLAGAVTWLWQGARTDTFGAVSFDNRLIVPPLAESHVDAEGRRVFDLAMQRGTTEFRDGVPTRTWGVNGSYLGPTLRAERGERVLMHVRNDLGEVTTLHWHGMHLPARMDGGPHQPIEPGATWSPTWRIDQPAATLWYHPHLMGETAEHVYRGVAGMFILDDDNPAGRALPHTYGVDDVPVIVQDRKFDDDGQFDLGSGFIAPTGLLGDTVLVNGTAGPYLDVTTQRVRLRLLNASNARVYDFGFDDNRSFQMVASGSGLLPAPYTTRRIMLAPGERAEIVVTLRSGERTVLRSYPPDLGTDFFNTRFAGGDDSLDILQLRAAPTLRPSPAVPDTLAEPPGFTESDVDKTRTFRLSGTSINGEDMDMGRIDDVVHVGDTELWAVSNADAQPHSFHVHDVRFQVLDIDGAPPPPQLAGWKDTIYVPPSSTARLVMRFTDYADPQHPYMFHCHMLTHEDRGMMGQFVVVRDAHRQG